VRVPEKSVPGMITTVITSFNKGPYLAEAIESALRQDYQPHEVIVIDDGSTDGTAEVGRSFGDRIRYIYQPNRGQCNAKNRGIVEARGEYVAFLDGDDRWRKGKLTKQARLFRDNPRLAVVYTDRTKFEGDRIVVPNNRALRHRPFRGMVLDHLIVDNFVPFSSALVRRECLIDVGMLDEDVPVAPDYDLWLRLARKYEFDFIDEILLDYRLGIDSIGRRVGNKFQHGMRIQRRFVDRFYNGKYPNGRVIAKATARKYAGLGDAMLSGARRGEALKAYLLALRHDPLTLRSYVSVARCFCPEWLAAGLKSLRCRRNGLCGVGK
jgi:glycosyltransferase involved in cell wall biosynthesis